MPDRDKTERAARAFDIRRIIGGLFLLYGVTLFVLGLGASDADLKRADGFNANLWVGIALLIVSVSFIAWALWRPLAPPRTSDSDGSASDDASARPDDAA
jgi:hypothetical protein